MPLGVRVHHVLPSTGRASWALEQRLQLIFETIRQFLGRVHGGGRCPARLVQLTQSIPKLSPFSQDHCHGWRDNHSTTASKNNKEFTANRTSQSAAALFTASGFSSCGRCPAEMISKSMVSRSCREQLVLTPCPVLSQHSPQQCFSCLIITARRCKASLARRVKKLPTAPVIGVSVSWSPQITCSQRGRLPGNCTKDCSTRMHLDGQGIKALVLSDFHWSPRRQQGQGHSSSREFTLFHQAAAPDLRCKSGEALEVLPVSPQVLPRKLHSQQWHVASVALVASPSHEAVYNLGIDCCRICRVQVLEHATDLGALQTGASPAVTVKLGLAAVSARANSAKRKSRMGDLNKKSSQRP